MQPDAEVVSAGRCPACGAVVMTSARFCGACGVDLLAPSAAQPAPVARTAEPPTPEPPPAPATATPEAPLAPPPAMPVASPIASPVAAAGEGVDGKACDWCNAVSPRDAARCVQCGAVFATPEGDEALERAAQSRIQSMEQGLRDARRGGGWWPFRPR